MRCARWKDIDYRDAVPQAEVRTPLQPGAEVLHVDDMQKYYEVTDNSLGAMFRGRSVQYIKANEALNFTARAGETVAIVGESGCGKSTFAKVLMGLEEATDGSVFLGDIDLGNLPVDKRKDETIANLQMVFQNPFDTLNPSHTVGAQISRVIRKFSELSNPKAIEKRMLELLDTVKLPRDFARRRPRQLSGGQKQRVGIARAFAGDPAMVIADEPVSALDVSVQAAVTGDRKSVV